MTDRGELALELDDLQRRLRELVAISPGGAVFWAVFERKRNAIERHASRSELDFVRFRISGMLESERLVPGCDELTAYA